MKHLTVVSMAPVRAQDMTTEEKMELIVSLVTVLAPIIVELLGDKE